MSRWIRFVTPLQVHFRRQRAELLRRHFPALRTLRVCDLGGSRHFWEEMPDDLVPRDLVLLNIGENGQSRGHDQRMEHLRIELYDGQTIPFPDGHFDVLICNSVIEHVPPAERARLCGEMRRVSRYFFVQTPAYEFPLEPHFVLPAIHWLPRRLGRHLVPLGLWALLSKPTKAHQRAYFDEVALLSKRDVRRLFPDAEIAVERLAALPKSYIAHGRGTSSTSDSSLAAG